MAPDSVPTDVEDDISILSTPYVPDVQEARAMQSRLQTREEKLRALDLRIQNLCAQRDTLRRATAVAQTLLAPIRKLPPETLAEVFILCMPVVYDPDVRDFLSNSHSGNPAPIRQCLREVCRRWRDILDDTPRAWAALVFDSSLPEDLSAVQKLLRKSKSCPLDIFINPNAWAGDTDPGRAHIRAMLKMLRGEVKRFRRFYGDVKRTDSAEFLRELFPCDEHSNAPVMEAFGVRTLSNEGDMGVIMAPKLQSIDLQGAASPLGLFTTASFPSMRQLRLKLSGRYIGVTSYLSSLVHFPQLESLYIDGRGLIDRGGVREPYQLGIKIPLQALKNLKLPSIHKIDAEELLQSLHVPCLDSIHLGLRGNNVSVTRVLSHSLAQMGITLQHLNLKNVDMAGDDAQWLSKFVNIRSLAIGGRRSVLSGTLISILVPPASTQFGLWVCPRLETLIFHRLRLPGADFLRLVRGRTQTDGEEPRPGYLKCLSLSYCSGLDDVYVELLVELMNRPSFSLFAPED